GHAHPRVLREEPGDRPPGDGLARARLADDADALAPADGEAHGADGVDMAVAPGRQLHREVGDLEERAVTRAGHHFTLPIVGLRESLRESPSMLIASTTMKMHRPGKRASHQPVAI